VGIAVGFDPGTLHGAVKCINLALDHWDLSVSKIL